MTQARLLTVDAFTDRPFTGNPAAVVMLEEMPTDEWMMAVARETNLSDTAFVIKRCPADADFRLRWFTPVMEVDLCGHATLASAHCLFEDGASSPIRFATRSGALMVSMEPGGWIAMDFPACPPSEIEIRAETAGALGSAVEWTGRTDDGFFLLALLADERLVRELSPDLLAVSQLEASAVIVTSTAAPGQEFDFVSRLFAPNAGIPEDPVTGSSHTVLAPFWARRLGRTTLVGMQASWRPGLVGVTLNDARVVITGRAVTVFDGALQPPPTHLRELKMFSEADSDGLSNA